MVLSSRREEGKKVSSGLHFTSNTKLAEILQQKELWRTLLYWLNATSTHLYLYFFINWQFIVKNSFRVFVCLLFQCFILIFLMNAVVIFYNIIKLVWIFHCFLAEVAKIKIQLKGDFYFFLIRRSLFFCLPTSWAEHVIFYQQDRLNKHGAGSSFLFVLRL